MNPTVSRVTHRTLPVLIAGLIAGAVWPTSARLAGQQTTPPPTTTTQTTPATGQRGGRGAQTPIDEQRARQLYVSNKFEDHSRPNFQAQIDEKAKEDARYAAACKGIMECTKITYRSSVGDMDIPAYLFQPLTKRGARRPCRDDLGARRRARQLGHLRTSRSCARPCSAATSSSRRSIAAAPATAKRTIWPSTTAARKWTT